MIDQSQQNTTLRVCLDDVGAHNKAVLDFFFAKLGKDTFQCVDTQAEANVLFIDYDFPPARQRYESEYQSWNKPAIILSISEVKLDNVIWLAKPLTSRALLDSAASVQDLLPTGDSVEVKPTGTRRIADMGEPLVESKTPWSKRPVIKEAETKSSEALVEMVCPLQAAKDAAAASSEESVDLSDTQESSVTLPEASESSSSESVDSEASEMRWGLLCGDQADLGDTTNLSALQSEESFFLSSIKDAVRLARQCQQGVLLNFPQTKIYILPEIHRIFCPVAIESDEFTQLIDDCNSGEGGKMHILSTPEIHELNDLITNQANALYDLESFVWSSTLLSAQGSLPRDLDPHKTVGLKHWPSMTRVESFPHAMPIAAQWSAQSMSAFDVAKTLNIPQRYVFSFYNAANTLGLIEMDPEKLLKKQSAPRTTEAPRGLFSRLLKRLVGG